MDVLAASTPSPFQFFSAREWADLRADTPMTLSAEELARLRSLNDPISLAEAESIYLPLTRLLSFYVESLHGLHAATSVYLGKRTAKMPFIIGVAGSVAVGKSTTARILQALLSRWPASPTVELITTDGFLHPNAVLEERALMERKGFPESYDRLAFLRFLADVKAGKPNVTAPLYSHLSYDVLPEKRVTIDRPNILIVEGLNILQPGQLPEDGRAIPFVSDFLDFSIYIDADNEDLLEWYVQRFMRLRETAFKDPGSFFHRFSKLNDSEAVQTATDIWNGINLPNLKENILPTRARADLILHKGNDHLVETVALRKL